MHRTAAQAPVHPYVLRGFPSAGFKGRTAERFRTRDARTVVAVAVVPHEQPLLPTLMERGAVKRQGRGRRRIRPDAVVGDKGDSGPTIRRYLKEHDLDAVIPTKSVLQNPS